MLVLSRKIGERIRIGRDIEITVLRAKSGGVRLGFDAPQNVNIVRRELLNVEKQENIEVRDTAPKSVGVDSSREESAVADG